MLAWNYLDDEPVKWVDEPRDLLRGWPIPLLSLCLCCINVNEPPTWALSEGRRHLGGMFQQIDRQTGDISPPCLLDSCCNIASKHTTHTQDSSSFAKRKIRFEPKEAKSSEVQKGHWCWIIYSDLHWHYPVDTVWLCFMPKAKQSDTYFFLKLLFARLVLQVIAANRGIISLLDYFSVLSPPPSPSLRASFHSSAHSSHWAVAAGSFYFPKDVWLGF